MSIITVTALAKEKEVGRPIHAATWRGSELWWCHQYLRFPNFLPYVSISMKEIAAANIMDLLIKIFLLHK